jgi:hypothetical protein
VPQTFVWKKPHLQVAAKEFFEPLCRPPATPSHSDSDGGAFSRDFDAHKCHRIGKNHSSSLLNQRATPEVDAVQSPLSGNPFLASTLGRLHRALSL